MALFGSHPVKQDSLADLNLELQRSSKRLGILERDANDLEKNITVRDEKLDSDFKEMESEMALLQEEITNLHRMMRRLMKHTQKLIINLQGKSKKEDMEKISRFADRWAPEGFINKRVFIKMAGEEIKEHLLRQRS